MLQRIYCRHLHPQRRAGPRPVPHREWRLDAPVRFPYHLFHDMLLRLMPRDHSMLLDLRDQGAALAEDLRAWFPSSAALRVRLLGLVRSGYIGVVGHHEGRRIYGLGPRGKRHLGIRSNWRTRPQEAFRQVIWRRCHARLVAEGYYRAGPWRGGLVLYRGASSPSLAVQVFPTGPSVRHLREIFRRHRSALLRDGAVLCVFSPGTLVLQRCVARFSTLLWRPLPEGMETAAR